MTHTEAHAAAQVVTIKGLWTARPDAKDGRIIVPLGSGSSPTPPPRAGDGDRDVLVVKGFELYVGLD
jgi:hypothetical protein